MINGDIMTVPILFDKKENCCGCAGCLNICPVGAITMKCDEYGFEYPEICEGICINCGRCKRVCGYQNESILHSPIFAYAAVSTNTDVMDSASGGVFASISDKFLLPNENTVVGASLESIDGKITPKHIAVHSAEGVKKLWGSKYVHSDTSQIFSEAENLLKNNKKVLFSGTPCQVAALYSYLGKDYDNLYTIDLICHGVPSRKMFDDYLSFISDKYGRVKDFVFRDKKHGLAFVSRAVCEKNGKESVKYIQYGENAYYTYFLQGNTYRDCCYSCKYATQKRVGDITIGDYWGIKAQHPELFNGTHPEFNADKGISCLLINTQKGERLIDIYGTGLSLHKSTFEKIAAENSQLKIPSVPKGDREGIMNAYKTGGYRQVDRIFKKQAGVSVILAHIKAKTPLWIKKLIKK